ncbi:MAG: c-type cytochrome [Kangiellaceae bacterium]|nr:c-type cytochrome [Kangiellaceae bacterium]
MKLLTHKLNHSSINLSVAAVLGIALMGCGTSSSKDPLVFETKAVLGESLYSDVNLSLNRTQSCATCHNPEVGFIDNRLDADGQTSAVSLGDDGISLGDRNTPTASYARFSPDFHIGTKQRFNSQQPDYVGELGGQFVDGRETDLQGQAEGPPTNPIEMGMADKASVVARIQENEDYVNAFEFLYGEDIFANSDEAYSAMAESIAVFEKTDEFSPFDSKYDRFLKGEYLYDPLSKSAAGKALFFSQQFTNCATCHQLHPNSHPQETFSSYEYHNIGVPVNDTVRLSNGKPANFVDQGLLDNEAVSENTARGKFKTPTLRNVAVTGPYMHNGVFRELKTVMEFYDHFLTNSEHVTNPETGESWGIPEVEDNVASTELEDGRKLSSSDIEGLVCFLRTLTDARYEHLIEENGIACLE